jgi:hypothetical protein
MLFEVAARVVAYENEVLGWRGLILLGYNGDDPKRIVVAPAERIMASAYVLR